jgi:hypothetical protein
LSREEVKKYFEVRFFSLAVMAIGMFVVCVFLFFFFMSRGQYVYAVAVIALAVVILLATVELLRYAKILKKHERAEVQKTQTAPFKSVSPFHTNYLKNNLIFHEEVEYYEHVAFTQTCNA